ncbi:hypothetical protein VB711_08795 [Cronbergia sp. UHCC 0137]|uniref:hypothetical protein n=1 Tax=Cronbergia sp. UHCC 0137 TaxID=3110239 RepID=UPI002B2085A1|nr:hypothetical protein [Cronbergia sp. UHCC 0137]MEA5617934.1 hypothetical protein [Cronbergia sp. UHCC 0137]
MNKTVTQRDELTKKRTESEKMHDVALLLQNLVNNEEATVKLILGCLYDIGSVNLINQKFRLRSLNWIVKSIAKMSKPAFSIFAWYWFKNNCPQLIADWLYSKVSVEYPIEKSQNVNVEVLDIQPYSPPEIEVLSRDIKYLHYQVRVLMGICIAALLGLGIAVNKLIESSQPALETRQQIQLVTPP